MRVHLGGALALLLSCCTADPLTCSPENCAGCCDGDGVCQPGVFDQACGARGVACMACGAGRVCVASACGDSPADAGSGEDAGRTEDAGTADAGGRDAGMDGGADAGGSPDAGSDSGSPDAGPPSTCASPTPITFMNGTFETGGFLIGESTTSTMACGSVTTLGPDRVFSFDLPSPGYVFAAQWGNATSEPRLELFSDACMTSLGCRSASRDQWAVINTSALAAGTYVLVADSSTDSSGEYALVVSSSSRLGDDCDDARALVLDGTRTIVAGHTAFLTSGPLEADCGYVASDQVFELVAPRGGVLSLSIEPAGMVLSVHEGASCATATQIAGACESGAGSDGLLTVPVTAGSTYYVSVGTGTWPGGFTLEAELP